MRRSDIRNLVIIAHVDHGKTTLVDCLLRQSGQFRQSQLAGERILDSNELERERGITILAKNIALEHAGVKINIIDTPGHADFGGEVERVVRMADGALVLVDAAEGPMPQTRFVLSKAFEAGLQPIVVVNKIDRPDARPEVVLDKTFELFEKLGADDELLDFPYLFASAKEGFATHQPDEPGESMRPLLDLVLETVPGPEVDEGAALSMLVTTLDWSEYVGRIAIGRLQSGEIRPNQTVLLAQAGDARAEARVAGVSLFDKLGRVEVERATAGDIAAVIGLDTIEIGDTITEPASPQIQPRLEVDAPTLRMTFGPNTSPFAGREGRFVTGRHLRERLLKETERNVALEVEPVPGTDLMAVSGRGLLHLSVLVETMRREGYEMSIGKPEVIVIEREGKRQEPYETLVVEAPPEHLGAVMELAGTRRAQTIEMAERGDFTQVRFSIPARGLIGLRTRMLNATQGTAMMHHRFEKYGGVEGEIAGRANGVLVSMVTGRAVAFGLDGLQQRAELFVGPGDDIYEGMIVGENSRSEDMTVNPTKEKKLTNIRAAGSDANILLKPPKILTLELALEYVETDEVVEVTPSKIRLRKQLLSEADRRRAARRGA